MYSNKTRLRFCLIGNARNVHIHYEEEEEGGGEEKGEENKVEHLNKLDALQQC